MTEFLSNVWKWVKRYLLAPLPAILIIAGAIVLVVLGAKNVQIGGLLGKLFGHKDPDQKAVDAANTIPEDRVDSNGKLIPIGTPDSKGITQAAVVPIESPGLFSNPDHVVIQHPDTKETTVVQLPDGVKAKDVDKVVIVSPEVVAVTVKDNTGITSKSIDDLLAKYGG